MPRLETEMFLYFFNECLNNSNNNNSKQQKSKNIGLKIVVLSYI